MSNVYVQEISKRGDVSHITEWERQQDQAQEKRFAYYGLKPTVL